MFKRKEVIGDCTLYLGDCLDILPALEKVDAVVADPPYGIGYIPRGGKTTGSLHTRNFSAKDRLKGDDGQLSFDPTPFLSLANEHIWWGANHYADKLPNTRGWLVWYKARQMEGTAFSHAELAWTNKQSAIRGFDYRWMGLVRDGQIGEASEHPTQKPLAVMNWCLSFIEGETILDPFMGSGTTGVACAKMNRKFIGIEIEEKYFDIACRRIEEVYRQGDLFYRREWMGVDMAEEV